VDVIFAIDSSADTVYHWPNGTSLVATYERSINATGIENGTAFPHIPDQNTFVNLGLNKRPTFFGCNSGNMSGPSPLIVYLPNSPYIYNSNVTTFDPSYNNTERNAIVQNGYDVATMANGTTDSQWPTCGLCYSQQESGEDGHKCARRVPAVLRSTAGMALNSTTSALQPKISLTPVNVKSGATKTMLTTYQLALLLGALVTTFATTL
jgi:hypothetical protein